MTKFISLAEFDAAVFRQSIVPPPAIRSPAAVSNPNLGPREIGYIFSDQSVARDQHTIATNGWVLDHFEANPVFLFAHDSSSPPIGKVTKIEKRGTQLVGVVEYADRETYDFADTIFRLTKGGFMNATSVSWLPLEWKATTDRKRPGGYDFTRQELLEISAVPVPALPTALVTARAAGIDTQPMFDWAERMLDSQGFASVGREELEQLRREARMPARGKSKTILEAPAAPEFNIRAFAKTARKRGLYELSSLCSLVEYATYVCERIEQEAEDEKDGSPIPARMREWVNEGNRIIAAMAKEETDENIQGTQDEVEDAVDRGLQRALAALGLDDLTRAGKKISAETRAMLKRAHGHAQKAVDALAGLIGEDDDTDPEADPADEPDDDSAENERKAKESAERETALAERRARAIKLAGAM